MSNKVVSDWQQRFASSVRIEHIKYSWDAGHAYSFINHPLMDELDDMDELDSDMCRIFSNDWLYENDSCPPCKIYIVDGVVRSICGCHDHLDYEKDREEILKIIDMLMNYEGDWQICGC